MISLFFSFNTYSQKKAFSIIKKYDKTIEITTANEYKLVIISSAGCGYCILALKKLQVFEDKIKIIVVDYDTEEKLEKLRLKYPYTFLEGGKIKRLGKQNFFPKLYLYNKNDKLIWKHKGWFNSNIGQIESKIEHNKKIAD